MKLIRHSGKLILALAALTATVAWAGDAHPADRKYRTIYTFQGGTDGDNPICVPAIDKDGNLYGTTVFGGLYDDGTIFKLTAPKAPGGKWKKTVLHNFAGGNDGQHPVFITFGPGGLLYGVAYGNIYTLAPPKSGRKTWKFHVIFRLNPKKGGSFGGNPVFDAAGNIYGAASSGGDFNCGYNAGCGTVLEIKRPRTKKEKWKLVVLHTFTGPPDGESPFADPTFDQQGNLWGTTYRGGNYGAGSVYRLSPPEEKGQGWTESVVYSFDQSNDNIISPEGPVLFDSSGNLYSTTFTGGDPNCDGGFGCGVVFELSYPDWTYSTLYAFQGGEDGIAPMGNMVFDAQRNLYSTTPYGGGGRGYSGIAFQLAPPANGNNWSETVLHRFRSYVDDGPAWGVTWGKWGDLYGVADYTGPVGNGTVFEVSP